MGDVIDATKKFLTAEDILGAADMAPIEVNVPEWGGVVLVRPMSAEEGTLFQDMSAEDKKHSNVKVAVMCIIGQDGKQLFSEAQAKQLRGKSLAAFMRIQRVVLKINGMTDEEAKAAKNV